MEQPDPTPTDNSSVNGSITSASIKTNPTFPSAKPTPMKRPHRYVASGHTASAPIFGRAELAKGSPATELYMGEKPGIGADADEYEEVEYYEEYEENPDSSAKPPETTESGKSDHLGIITNVPLPPRYFHSCRIINYGHSRSSSTFIFMG